MKTNQAIPHFKTMTMADVPESRSGKHKKIVTAILRDLDDLRKSSALKAPLAELGTSKENFRSALSRAVQKSALDENSVPRAFYAAF
jgi:hypothetical protein